MMSSKAPPSRARCAVVIPALNESAAIEKVVLSILAVAHPVVVDDGSTDATGEIARKAGASVVRHPINKGYDAALESGLRYSLEQDFDFAITMDADGQHNPHCVAEFQELFAGGADLIVGVRDKHQRFTETVFARVGEALWNLKDPLCGMKAYRLDLLRKLPALRTYDSIGTELALRLSKQGASIQSVPMVTRERVGASRFGSGLRANYRIFRALLRGLSDYYLR